MTPESDMLVQVLQSLDGFIALGIAIWVINLQIKRFDAMEKSSNDREDVILERHEKLTMTILEASAARNDQLMSLVSTLCAQPVRREVTGSPLSQGKGSVP